MKKKDWLIVFLPLVIVWYLDRISKGWGATLVEFKSYNLIHFALYHNPGAILGLFSDLPPVLRIVTLSTGGAFLVVTYAIIQYLLPIKSLTLRSGMSILLGGILGNVTDRILWGHVVDFIILGTQGTWLSPAFNLADAFQWFGYGMVVYAIIKEGQSLWPENNFRRKYWINPKFQLKYCYFLLGIGLSIGLISVVFSYTYMRVALIELVGPNSQIISKFLNPFVFTFGSICLAFSIGLFAVGKIISHKMAGPIFAFEKYMTDLIEAKEPRELNAEIKPFKLRVKDEFKELETIAALVVDKLNKPH
jgi:signal peptidase II